MPYEVVKLKNSISYKCAKVFTDQVTYYKYTVKPLNNGHFNFGAMLLL